MWALSLAAGRAGELMDEHHLPGCRVPAPPALPKAALPPLQKLIKMMGLSSSREHPPSQLISHIISMTEDHEDKYVPVLVLGTESLVVERGGQWEGPTAEVTQGERVGGWKAGRVHSSGW